MTTIEGKTLALITASTENGMQLVAIGYQDKHLVMPPHTAFSIADKLAERVKTMEHDETLTMELAGINDELRLDSSDAARLSDYLTDLATQASRTLN